MLCVWVEQLHFFENGENNGGKWGKQRHHQKFGGGSGQIHEMRKGFINCVYRNAMNSYLKQ